MSENKNNQLFFSNILIFLGISLFLNMLGIKYFSIYLIFCYSIGIYGFFRFLDAYNIESKTNIAISTLFFLLGITFSVAEIYDIKIFNFSNLLMLAVYSAGTIFMIFYSLDKSNKINLVISVLLLIITIIFNIYGDIFGINLNLTIKDALSYLWPVLLILVGLGFLLGKNKNN